MGILLFYAVLLLLLIVREMELSVRFAFFRRATLRRSERLIATGAGFLLRLVRPTAGIHRTDRDLTTAQELRVE
ncbi:hypothetical protein [Spirochaeta africana]|nr:hypothetical protein [Spirochaeta africana]